MRVLKRTWPYDMWSLGVTWLELVMGTPHVFQVDPRTRVKLYHQLRMDAMSDVSHCIRPSPCDILLLELKSKFLLGTHIARSITGLVPQNRALYFARVQAYTKVVEASVPTCLGSRNAYNLHRCCLQGDMQLAFWLRGLMELCIYPPQPGMHPHQRVSGHICQHMCLQHCPSCPAFASSSNI